MGKKLVLVGGGHAHMVTLANLKDFTSKGFEVVVVGPSPYHYYSGMGPGMLGKTYSADDIRFATRHVVENSGGKFISGKARKIDPVIRMLFLESGETVSYDVISFNAGSFIPRESVASDNGDIYAVKPIEKLQDAQTRILALLEERPITIGIVGGGPAAVEIAGNVWRLSKYYGRHESRIIIFSGKPILSRFSDRVRKLAVDSLTKRNIAILENTYAKTVETGRIITASGATYAADIIFLAGGVRPSSIFHNSALSIGPDGGLLVNSYLQSIDYPEIFGGGDCIHFKDTPLDKVGVYAVRENPVIFHNLMAALEEKPLIPFDPGGDYLLIFNLGDGTGIFEKKGLVFGGRPAFWIKDYIDRRFMKRFQAIE